jgi:hypothetical protein
MRREEQPAPYDVAQPGTPEDKVITKGERERPGPTADELDDNPADDDEVLQANQPDREGATTPRRGKPGDLGGQEMLRQNNPDLSPDDLEPEAGER